MRVEKMLEKLIGLSLNEKFVEQIYIIYEESLCSIHTSWCMETFKKEDGCHYIYGDNIDSPIIGIMIKNGQVVKAWEYTECL